MFLMIILLFCFGIVMLIWPNAVWVLVESWKHSDDAKPSTLYLWSTRFGGTMIIIICTAYFIMV